MRLRRLFALCLCALGLLLGGAGSAEAAGPADAAAESRFVGLLNGARASAGLPPVAVSGDLVSVARQHAAEMADRGALYHSGAGSRVGGWKVISENVGRGSSVDHVHGLLMGSAPHRANIVDGRVSQVGVGVVWSGSTLYVTQIFRQPHAAPAVAPPPAPRPRPPVTVPPPSPPPPPPPPTTTSTSTSTSTTSTTSTTVLRPAHTAHTAHTTPDGPPGGLAALGSVAAGSGLAGWRLVRRRFWL